MRSFSLADFMRLDTAVVGALNLLPNPAEAQQHRASSVYGLLNHCKTAMGSRLLSAWIKQPLLDLAQVRILRTIPINSSLIRFNSN